MLFPPTSKKYADRKKKITPPIKNSILLFIYLFKSYRYTVLVLKRLTVFTQNLKSADYFILSLWMPLGCLSSSGNNKTNRIVTGLFMQQLIFP